MKLGYFSNDVQDLFRALLAHEVKYLIVGGEAVIYYGHARLTGDIDIFFEPSSENAARLYSALTDFWQDRPPGIESEEELSHEGMIFQFGVPPNRIDLLNTIDGVVFGECWPSRIIEEASSPTGTLRIYYIGLRDLIINKKASARPKDLDDIVFLKRASEKN